MNLEFENKVVVVTGGGYCGDGAVSVLGEGGISPGENVCIDGGMIKLMIYHGDHGWSLE